MTPPPGWFPAGHHRGQPKVRLVLSWTHLGDDGMPLWECPIREQFAAPEHHETTFGEQQVLFA